MSKIKSFSFYGLVTLLSLSSFAFVGGAGYLLYQYNYDNGKTTQQEIATNNQPNNMATNTKPLVKPRQQGITSQQLAESKNVPLIQERNDGKYTLIAVVEGQDANKRLSQAINTISLQRRKLTQLRQQFNILPVTALQQRELIAGEINKLEKTLKANLKYMQVNFAYNLSNQYLLVPEKAKLHAISPEGELSQEGHDFESFEEYESFMKANLEYQTRLNELITAWSADVEANEQGQKVIKKEELRDLKKNDEKLREIAKSIDEKFDCDIDQKHNITFEKSAFYVKTEAN